MPPLAAREGSAPDTSLVSRHGSTLTVDSSPQLKPSCGEHEFVRKSQKSDWSRHFMSEQGKKKGGWKPKRADWRAGIGAEVSVAPSLVLALAVMRVPWHFPDDSQWAPFCVVLNAP